jgi:transposase
MSAKKHSGKKRQKDVTPAARPYRGNRAHSGGQTLQSWTVGALPIVNRLLERMRLEDILRQHLPPDDPRLEVPTTSALLVLVRNVLFSREPIYGLAEWAERYAPDLLGLTTKELEQLNDDRVGRSLDRLFDGTTPQLVMDVVRHVVREFNLKLDELHNDSTTVSFYGAYEQASEASQRRGKPTAAITFGHSKDHRPDLKQLLYTLTVTDDGSVPVYFTTASGNVTDDTTHRETWDLLRELIGRPDFLYVADCKLATSENLQYIANSSGRFVSILPRTRREDREFRRVLVDNPKSVSWQLVFDVTDDEGELVDRLQVCSDAHLSAEGFRLLWFHSTRKAIRDAAWRTRAIERTQKELEQLRQRLQSPKTRFRQRSKVEQAVQQLLATTGGGAWVQVQIEETEQATYKQAARGRPGKETKYTKQITTRFNLSVQINHQQVAEDEAGDGVFPLITNDRDMSEEELLRAYKRQPLIEKRFSQFKTDFEVAPMHLQEISRIHALLCVYFFALLVQTLLERELRRAMVNEQVESLPLYPESRACRAPTTRRLLDVFDNVQRHCLRGPDESTTFVTQLTPLQRDILKLLGFARSSYGR